MDTGKQMRLDTAGNSNIIELDKDRIRSAINSKGIYKEEGVEIKNWEGDKNSEYYLGLLKRGSSSYLGILNTLLKRHNYGINQYENGDIYFGNFDSDMKDGHGIYFFSPTIQNGFINSEIYYGYWRENQKDKTGIYMWLKEKQGVVQSENKLEGVDFDAFIGDIENDCYSRGCYLTKLGNSYYVYYGGFDQDGRKNDENGYFYDNVRETIFRGKIVNDKFTNGYMISLDKNDELKNIIFIELDSNDAQTKLLKSDEIEEEERNKIYLQAKEFKSALVEKDYFTVAYEKVKIMRTYVNTKVSNLSIFDSEDDYPKMLKLSSEYNIDNMYKEVKNKENRFL